MCWIGQYGSLVQDVIAGWLVCVLDFSFVHDLQAPTTVQENMPSSSTTVQENMPSSQPSQSQTQFATQESTNYVYTRRRQVNPAAPPPATQTQTIIRPGQGGMGVMFDENSGSYIYNVSLYLLFQYYTCLFAYHPLRLLIVCCLQPAQQSERVLEQGPAAQADENDNRQKKFPIPNERAKRLAKSTAPNHTYSQVSGRILLRQSQSAPTNPVQPPNLGRVGSRVITTRQLLAQRDGMVSKTRSGTKYHEGI